VWDAGSDVVSDECALVGCRVGRGEDVGRRKVGIAGWVGIEWEGGEWRYRELEERKEGWDMVMGREITNDDFPQNTSAVERKLVSHSSAKLADKEELASYHYPISIKPDLVRSITLSTVDPLC